MGYQPMSWARASCPCHFLGSPSDAPQVRVGPDEELAVGNGGGGVGGFAQGVFGDQLELVAAGFDDVTGAVVGEPVDVAAREHGAGAVVAAELLAPEHFSRLCFEANAPAPRLRIVGHEEEPLA